MTYRRQIRVEFNHCDPAGIVFFPRYYEMANSVLENFFREVVDYPYHRMMEEGFGAPTVRIETDFTAPSRLGDLLDWSLRVTRLGTSSASFALAAEGAGQARIATLHTLVWLGADKRATPWPEEIRKRLAALQEGT